MNIGDLRRTNYEHLKVFARVAQYESITRAAKSLFITQPAVSHTIARLEESLGVTLFDRTGNRMRLTAIGRELHEMMLSIERELQAGQRKLDTFRNLEGGQVTLCVPILLMHYCLMPVIEQFHRRFPQVTLDVQIENRMSRLLEMLDDESRDFVILTVPAGERIDDAFDCTQLGTFTYGFAANRNFYGHLQGRTVSLSEINVHPLIALTRGHIAREYLERAFSRHGLEMNVVFDCQTMALAEDFIRAGFGIGMEIRGCVHQMQGEPDIFHIQTRENFEQGPFMLIRKRTHSLNPAALMLERMLLETDFS